MATTKRGAAKRGAPPPARTPARRASLDGAVGKEADDKMIRRDQSEELDIPGVNISRYSNQADFGRDEIFMPKLRLGQSMTPEVQDKEASMGQYLAGAGEEPVDSAVIVPMVYARGQILNEDDAIVCSSQDAVTGVGDPGGNCKACPKNQWTKNKKTGKSVPPECVFYFDYGIWSVTHQAMMTFLLKKTALNVAKQINTLVQKFGFGNFAIELGAIIVPGAQGKFAVPTVKMAKVSEKELANAREQFTFGG